MRNRRPLASVYIFTNSRDPFTTDEPMLMIFDQHGKQVRQLQGRWSAEVWARILRRCTEGTTFATGHWREVLRPMTTHEIITGRVRRENEGGTA